jgi:uncharacterized protein (TIGR00730 family)
MPRRICVFCGSSSGARPSYTEAAAALGQYLAQNRITVVYGGGKVGLMGALADAALAVGGEVIGRHAAISRREGTVASRSAGTTRGRIHAREEGTDGGSGRCVRPSTGRVRNEFCEVLTWTQLGLHRKPCGILNVDGYYDQLLSLFDHAVDEEFLKPVHRQIVPSDKVPASLVTRILAYLALGSTSGSTGKRLRLGNAQENNFTFVCAIDPAQGCSRHAQHSCRARPEDSGRLLRSYSSMTALHHHDAATGFRGVRQEGRDQSRPGRHECARHIQSAAERE